MDDQVLHLGAYGLIFLLGMALVLRPLVILTTLIFRPGFLALAVLLALGARAAMVAAPAESAPLVASGVLAFVIGSAIGFPLRALTRGGL